MINLDWTLDHKIGDDSSQKPHSEYTPVVKVKEVNQTYIGGELILNNNEKRKCGRPKKIVPDVLGNDKDMYASSNSQIDKIFERRKLVQMPDETVQHKTNEVKKERRGRKKAQPRKYVDPSIKLNTIQMNRNSEQKPDIGPAINVDLVCGACDEVFHDKWKVNYHILSTHNGLARVNSKEPFTTAEENEALRLCLRRLKRLQCPKSSCQKCLTTLAGFKHHLQTCGSAEKVRCKVCEAELKPSSLSTHMKNSHTPKLKPIFQEDEPTENGIRRSRKAAVKARKSVQMFSCGSLASNLINTENEGDSYNPETEARITPKGQSEEWMSEQLISRDVNLAIVTPVLIEQWKLSLVANGIVNCPSETCDRTFSTIPGMRYHFQRCGKDMNFKCIECGFKAPKKITVKKHVITHFRPETDVPVEDENHTDLLCLHKTEINTRRQVTAPLVESRYQRQHYGSLSSKSTPKTPSLRTSPYSCYIYTFLDTFALSHKNMRHLLFDAWFPVPQIWKPLNPRLKRPQKYFLNIFRKTINKLVLLYAEVHSFVESSCPLFILATFNNFLVTEFYVDLFSLFFFLCSEYKAYLPRVNQSAQFKCKSIKSNTKKDKNSTDDHDTSDQTWSSLPLFGSVGKLGEHTCTMFAGGTVRALAWCPTPSGMSLENEHEQYLAVSADLNFQDIRQPILTQCISGPGLIQIWSMSVLSKYGLSTLPKLSYCIAHEFGQVKCLEWCNGGCYTVDDNYEGMERIGLLAAGCSDGYIYIYSVPRPESLSYNAEDNVIITKPSPVVQLKPPSCNVVTVMSISWYSAEGRNKIVGGFGNGLVCVWDLTTKSQLLWLDISSEFSTLVPYVSFMAHYGPVTTVAFCPNTGGEHFCTGSVDKEMKIWSDTNVMHPISSVKKTIVTNIHWSPLACGVFASYDDSYLYKQNRTYYHEAGYYGHPARCLAFHNSCVMSMSFSEWLNTIVTCDYAGEIVATVCYQYQEFFRKKKNHRLYKLTPLCRANIEKLNLDDIVDSSSPPTTYEQIVEKHGLVFTDSPVNDFSELPESESSRINSAEAMNPQPFSSYNLQSANAVSWNQNCGAHFWLASGFNAGFVRLHCVSGFDNPNLNSYDMNKLEQVIKDQANYNLFDASELNNTTVNNSVHNTSVAAANHKAEAKSKEVTEIVDNLNISTSNTSPENSCANSIVEDANDCSNEVPSINNENEDQSPVSCTDFKGETPCPNAHKDS
ncbi:General transcription factor 3C polypeptide 2 [Nymphon striatum]|nr:General transcription factor 3C polypeptide 2 [Nymphon striatum]